eukprot:jgi/Mesvir1/3833/Mv19799-RA.1
MADALHPYYPVDLTLEGFAPISWSVYELLGTFFAVAGVICVVTWIVSARAGLGFLDKLLMCWFVLCGVIHCALEGMFAISPEFYKSTTSNFFHEMWKEYSKADSRYAARESGVVAIESLTAFVVGPLCFITSLGIYKGASFRWSLQMITSMCQLYGDVVYFWTAYLEGLIHSRPEWLYFHFYFIIMNGIWIVVPLACVIHALKNINKLASEAKPAKSPAAKPRSTRSRKDQ